MPGIVVALKISISASQLTKTPVGFGDLIFYQPGNLLSGLPLIQLSDRIDSALTLWQGRTFTEFDSMYTAVHRINRAFLGPLDTLSWQRSSSGPAS